MTDFTHSECSYSNSVTQVVRLSKWIPGKRNQGKVTSAGTTKGIGEGDSTSVEHHRALLKSTTEVTVQKRISPSFLMLYE